jgi:hypothetical protein
MTDAAAYDDMFAALCSELGHCLHDKAQKRVIAALPSGLDAAVKVVLESDADLEGEGGPAARTEPFLDPLMDLAAQLFAMPKGVVQRIGDAQDLFVGHELGGVQQLLAQGVERVLAQLRRGVG